MPSNDIIEQLPDIIIPEYYDALGILFANRDWIPRFVDETGKERLGIIEIVDNNHDEAREAIKIGQKKWLKFVKPADDAISTMQKYNASEFTKQVIYSGMLDTIQLSTGIISKDFIEGVTANILEQYISKHQGQHNFFDNKNILRQLSSVKLKLIEPWVQASVCGLCHNFELLLSSYPKKIATCSQCSREMFTVRIYKLNSSFEIHKLDNKDLPLFIGSYIKSKKSEEKVHISHKITDVENSTISGDIDVYIPASKTGIECKLFVNPHPQGNQFESYKGEILNIFLKYAKFGINRFIAITNLSKKDALELEEKLKLQLKEKGLQEKHLRVGHFSMENLISILDEEISPKISS